MEVSKEEAIMGKIECSNDEDEEESESKEFVPEAGNIDLSEEEEDSEEEEEDSEETPVKKA